MVLAGGWWTIAEGDPAGLAFGAPIVLLALAASACTSVAPSPRWSLPGLSRFALAFLSGSLLGGVDVARRALAPRLPISPTLVTFALRLPAGPARNLFMATLSLMPGTLVADLVGDLVEVHVLAGGGAELTRQLRAMEAHVARALGEKLEQEHA